MSTMYQGTSERLSDVAAEKAVLAGICQYGQDGMIDVADIITTESFTIEANKLLYKSLEIALKTSDKLDIPTILAAANGLGIYEIITERDGLNYLNTLFSFSVDQSNVRVHAKRIAKLEITRRLQSEIKHIYTRLEDITGNETLGEILSVAERPVLDFANKINNQEELPVLLSENLEAYVEHLRNNTDKSVGISSGWSRYDSYIGGGFRRKTISLFGARMKVGKALKNGSRVYTPDGFKLIEEIKVGDIVSSPNGKTANVIAVYPQGQKDIYKITFNDGSVVECCKEHLWEVKFYKNNFYKVVNTEFLINENLRTSGLSQQHRFAIKLTKPVKYNAHSVPMDPYMLGLLLGDGSFRGKSLTFTSADPRLIEDIQLKLTNKYKIKAVKSSSYGYIISRGRTGGKENKYKKILNSLNLDNLTSHNKFIPDVYKYNSVNIRIKILQGLMDTDGSIDERGNCEYSTTSIQLANDIKEIVTSLGGICIIKSRYTSYDKNKNSFLSYRCSIKFNDNSICFNLNRKRNRTKLRTKNDLTRKIDKIEYVGKALATCITIDSKDGLFLTDNHIVTHNSVLADNIAIHVAHRLKIPVLMLDTEMSLADHQNRILAYFTKLSIKTIESGKFSGNPIMEEKVAKAVRNMLDMPYTYKNISGKPFEEVLAIIHRWLVKDVGVDENGVRKDCLVIYDYFKLMNSDQLKQLQEFQVLGFQISDLHNFCVRYDFPIVSFVQLNRDGITKETSDVVSQSDRLLWLCTNFTIFKAKDDKEIEEDGEEFGNRKLIPLLARHGPAIEEGNYINMFMQGEYAMVEELRTKAEIIKDVDEDSFEVEDDTAPFE